MTEPERSIEEMVEDIRECLPRECSCHKAYKGRNLTDPGCQWCDYGEDVSRATEAILRAVQRLRDYARCLPSCAAHWPRPADAPANLCSCGFAALTPKGGDRE